MSFVEYTEAKSNNSKSNSNQKNFLHNSEKKIIIVDKDILKYSVRMYFEYKKKKFISFSFILTTCLKISKIKKNNHFVIIFTDNKREGQQNKILV